MDARINHMPNGDRSSGNASIVFFEGSKIESGILAHHSDAECQIAVFAISANPSSEVKAARYPRSGEADD